MIITSDISPDETWPWLRKRNPKSETESLLITAQNNAIRTNHFKARIDKTQQNSRSRSCGDRDETINKIKKKECSKFAQKDYKTRHGLVSKVIHWDSCKKLKFEDTNKWYMDVRESPLGFDKNGSPKSRPDVL